MSTLPDGPGKIVSFRTRGRGKRLLFAAGLVFVLSLFTELLVFLTAAVYDHRLSWIASSQDRRDELQVELGDRPGLVLQVHPYVGYVETPPKAVGGDSSGRSREYGVTPYGYADTGSPIHTRAPDRVIIAVIGGSVAWSFHMHGTARLKALLQKDPALAGKDIVFVNLAVSGYKQPQQLMTLNYMLVLGAQFDIVINIDGFNEAALYEAENADRHVFPAFPRSWQNRVEVSGPRVEQVSGAGGVPSAESSRPGARVFAPSLEVFAALQPRLVDCRLPVGDQVHELEVEYHQSPSSANYVVEGPGWKFATPQDLHRHLAALWKNSSIQLDTLCAANGIRYYHFLQPNLLVAGSKPLTAAEQHMAGHRDDDYRPGVRGAYPLMIEAGRELKARGERFTDLTQMFAAHPEGLFVDICHSIRRATTCWPIGSPRRSFSNPGRRH